MAPVARLTPAFIIALATEAVGTEYGMILPIEIGHHDNAKYMIHKALRGTPLQERLMICAFPKDGEFWFVKRTVELDV